MRPVADSFCRSPDRFCSGGNRSDRWWHRRAVDLAGSDSQLRLIGEQLAGHHAGTWRNWPAIAGDAKDAALFQPLRDARGSITGIQPDRANVEVEALPLAVEPAEIDDRVMHVGGCSVGIGDDAEPAINGTVIEIEEALRLALAHHVAGIWIGP